jgi:hypothetical protein
MAYAPTEENRRSYSTAPTKGYSTTCVGATKGYALSPPQYTGPTENTKAGNYSLERLASTASMIPTYENAMTSTTAVQGITTHSYSITRHPDGSITETYSTTCSGFPNNIQPGYRMPAMHGTPSELTELLPSYGSAVNPYDTGEKELRKMRQKEDEADAKKQTMQNFEKLSVFNPDSFINSPTPFVGEAEEIMPYVEEAFRQTTGKALPNNFSLALCDSDDLKRAHKFFNGCWSDDIQGFCINRQVFGESRIFVKKDELAKVMLTIGHELGHIQTKSLKGIEEEAKAFAFSMEWMKKIKENDIAGLSHAIITEQPAQNGLHNVAFDFVANMLRQGNNAMDIFNWLADGMKLAA